MATASRFVQLAVPTIFRWQIGQEPGQRIDRAPFTQSQRDYVRRCLVDVGAVEEDEGRTVIATDDGGKMSLYLKYFSELADFNTINVLIQLLSPQIVRLVFNLMRDGRFMLFPMAMAANDDVAELIDCDWPKVTVVGSPEELHRLLDRGPYHWWKEAPMKR